MNRQPLHEALRAAGWSWYGYDPPGDCLGVWTKDGEVTIGEYVGERAGLTFEAAVLRATSERYRAMIGDCWECPIGHRHVDGVCVEDGCDCESRVMPEKWGPKR